VPRCKHARAFILEQTRCFSVSFMKNVTVLMWQWIRFPLAPDSFFAHGDNGKVPRFPPHGH
jgi:hypothetical protein